MRSLINSPDYLAGVTSINSKKVDEILGTNTIQKALEKALAIEKERDKWSDSLNIKKYVNEYYEVVKEQTRLRNLEELAGLSNAVRTSQKMIESFELSPSQHVPNEYADAISISRHVKSLNLGYEQANYLADLTGTSIAKEIVADTMASFRSDLNLKRATDSANWALQLSKSILDDDLFRKFAATLDIRKSLPTGEWYSAAETAKRHYDHLFSASEIWRKQIDKIAKPDYLTSILSVIQRDIDEQAGVMIFHSEELTDSNSDERLLLELSNADSPEKFAEIFSQLSHFAKWVMFGIIVYVLHPIMTGVAGNLVTPHVEQYLNKKPAAQQSVQVRAIKKLSMGELGIELKEYRFSTAKTLALRETPNARARKVGELHFGQVVAVVSVKRDWTEVIYEYGDGEIISGWVFTRYLEKFRR